MNNLLFDLRVTQPINDDKRHGGGKYGEIVRPVRLKTNR